MKVAIVGCREYPNLKEVEDYVNQLPMDTVVVSGGAIGVDSVAELTSKKRGMPRPIIFYPDWNKYGKRAGFLRNRDIVKECDRLVAFWDGESKGTKHSINFAISQNKEVLIRRCDLGLWIKECKATRLEPVQIPISMIGTCECAPTKGD